MIKGGVFLLSLLHKILNSKPTSRKTHSFNVFKNVVAVSFQSAFHSEMHQNNIFFYFLKINFNISKSK
jgi:hypothetical protein